MYFPKKEKVFKSPQHKWSGYCEQNEVEGRISILSKKEIGSLLHKAAITRNDNRYYSSVFSSAGASAAGSSVGISEIMSGCSPTVLSSGSGKTSFSLGSSAVELMPK